MFLDGMTPVALGSVPDQLRLTVWYRREQRKIFETMINLYANVISLNPDIAKRVEKMINEYLECVVPGSEEIAKKEAASTIKQQGDALKSIFSALQGYSQQQQGKGKKVGK